VFVAVSMVGIKLVRGGFSTYQRCGTTGYHIVTGMSEERVVQRQGSCQCFEEDHERVATSVPTCRSCGERVSTSLLRILKKFLIMMRNEATEVRLYFTDTTPASKCRVEWSAESDRSNETNPIETFFLSRVCFASSAARGSILRPDKL
jgi:ribosomal protein L37AE/L43A